MMNIEILHEDNHIIIINKKWGDIVQGDKTGDETLADRVKLYIKKEYNKPGNVYLGISHRLDRPTSGIVIFAKTSKALSRLNKMFAEKEIKKTYLAIIDKQLPKKEDTISHYLIRNRKQNKSYAHDSEKRDSKKAVLSYKLKQSSDKYYLVEINLETGRHHQIRAQLAKLGSHIKGDLKYGFPRSNPSGGIDLHAYSVEFEHPVSKALIKITAKPPEDRLWNYFFQNL